MREPQVLTQFHENLISVDEARTLDGLFAKRVHRSAERSAYRYYDRVEDQWRTLTWGDMARAVSRWQQAIAAEKLQPGDRVAIQLRNCPEWVMLDQAALSLGLVTVPLYTDDRPDNIAYILTQADVKLLVVQNAGRWRRLASVIGADSGLRRVVLVESGKESNEPTIGDTSLVEADTWLPAEPRDLKVRTVANPDDLASIVYTSGTTGRPKGVMLSHHNMLYVAHASLTLVDCYQEDVFLSILPLSHTLERAGGYYLPMLAGATVAYSRSVHQIGEDFKIVRPTVLIAVPRMFERVHARIRDKLAKDFWLKRRMFALAVKVGWRRFLHSQGRAGWTPSRFLWPLLERLVARKVAAGLGGRLRVAVSGGAPLSGGIARFFIGLGLPVLQGYGLTETSPVISVNPLGDNIPESVGVPIRGTQVKIGEEDELLVKGPGVMLGYWNNHAATAQILDAQGWLRTGDQVRIEDRRHIYITGRLKDILVLSNGEKIPPADIELAIMADGLFEQVMIVGEGRPYLAALAVLSGERWPAIAQQAGLNPLDESTLQRNRIHSIVLGRINKTLKDFPAYAKVRRISLMLQPWTVEEDLITPTLKIKRAKVLQRFTSEVDAMYAGGPAA